MGEAYFGKRILCVADTPYQAFSCFCLIASVLETSNTIERCDIVLNSLIPYVENLKASLIDSHLFNTVTIAHPSYEKLETGNTRYILSRLFRHSNNLDRIRNEAAELEHGYDTFLYAYVTGFVLDVKECFAPTAKTILYEDGTSSYCGTVFTAISSADDILSDVSSKLSPSSLIKAAKRRIWRLVVGKTGEMRPACLFVFRPELVEEGIRRFIRVERIKQPSPEVARFFIGRELPGHAADRKQIIYLTLPSLKNKSLMKMENDVIEKLAKHLGSTLFVKPHPQRKESFDYLGDYGTVIVPRHLLWEAMIASGYISSTTVLISVCSSAVITPMELYGLEPPVVFIWRMSPEEGDRLKIYEGIEANLRAQYSDATRVSSVSSIEELFIELSQNGVRQYD